MRLPPKLYQVLVGVFASLGSFLYGYDLTIVAEVVSSQCFIDKFNPSTAKLSLVASMLTAGAFFGAAIAGFISERFGRRWTIVTGGLIFCLGGALQTGAENYAMVIAGRFVAGLAIGVLVMIVPLYQAELVHPDIRGFVTGLVQFMLGVGGVVGSWLSYGTFVSFTDSRQWRIPFGVQIVPAAIIASMIFLFPESPRYLIAKGKSDEGLKTLARLHANGNIADPFMLAEYDQIQTQVTFEREREAKSLKELFSTKSSFRRVMLACGIQAATQMTGVSAIQYYSTTIFVAVMLVVDRIGRRSLIIAGNLGMCVTFIVSTILLAEFPPASSNTGAHWGFIAMTWVFNFVFASMGSLSWILPAEIFDTKTRSYGVALATMISFAFNTMIGQVTNVGMKSVGWRFYLLFVIGNFTNALFFWAFLQETKKLPLEEMESLFSKSPLFVGWRDMAAYREPASLAAMAQTHYTIWPGRTCETLNSNP
ncbi:hypothetical protein M409DRAFT_64631 [Zasmidium cellare ATCC 36951]|uniref:Major facilitator superfamily (MFS) profile domain-containing protein n=1 Tax=Zasmidium cellare ATCC 36951 TaxID=1080233 RepID=A0A6A6CR08_ZASCE|nr:uncharacterized protein M409DRAFT_64631 [Zasmidium cellare ATCC 36951]KAF2169511.1 hypothetical protein M409DRAFT_64631 [Zasmidium cellare ATCC 36951]